VQHDDTEGKGGITSMMKRKRFWAPLLVGALAVGLVGGGSLLAQTEETYPHGPDHEWPADGGGIYDHGEDHERPSNGAGTYAHGEDHERPSNGVGTYAHGEDHEWPSNGGDPYAHGADHERPPDGAANADTHH
jgi:hypothetical protein